VIDIILGDVLVVFARFRATEVVTPAFVPPLPLPTEREAWREALPAAQAFWALAAEDGRISDDFRRVCADNVALLAPLAARP
jgi:hypothetical protein